MKDPLLKECILSSDWLKMSVHKGAFIFPLLLYFLLSMFIIVSPTRSGDTMDSSSLSSASAPSSASAEISC